MDGQILMNADQETMAGPALDPPGGLTGTAWLEAVLDGGIDSDYLRGVTRPKRKQNPQGPTPTPECALLVYSGKLRSLWR
jgi:hypothetical protein